MQLFLGVQKILFRQARYLGTLESLLAFIQNEFHSDEERAPYWDIVASQLTAAEVKYIFYQCLVAREGDPLRTLIHKSTLISRRLPDTSIARSHVALYNRIHGVELQPIKRRPLLPYQRKEIRRLKKQFRKAQRQRDEAVET